MMISNPLLHRPGAGSATPGEASQEAGSTYTGHIPTVWAGVLVAAAVVLIAFDKGGFKFVVGGSAGKG
jgi:hypothetical protein